jgi:hypothetical protein
MGMVDPLGAEIYFVAQSDIQLTRQTTAKKMIPI